MENTSNITVNIPALGSVDAVKESGAFDELTGLIDREEIQFYSKYWFIQ